MLAFKIFPFIQALVIILCFILPLKKVSLKYKILLAIIFGLGSLKQYIYIFSGGDMMDPKLSRYPAIFFDTIYFSSIFLFLLTLIRMIINGVYKLSRLNLSKFIIPAQSTRYAALFLLIACLIGGRAVFNGFAPPVDKFYEITVKNLPSEANDLRIVELADLHISAPTISSEIEDIVKRVNETEPDLILIAGDFVDGTIEELDYMTKILFNLKAKYGVYAVSGNHELYSGYKNWIEYFEKGGIKFLENDGVIIRNEKGVPLLNVCGVIDISAPRFNLPEADIQKALANTDRNLPTIFMSHQPKLANQLKDKSDLTLCGHTHGGLMPGLKQIVAKVNGGYVSGLYNTGRQRVIVSNGTRIWAGAPLRLHDPSQIVYVTLKQ